MFVSIYKTIAGFPLDFTIRHGGMFTIRQRPVFRSRNTARYLYCVAGITDGKCINFVRKYCRILRFLIYVKKACLIENDEFS